MSNPNQNKPGGKPGQRARKPDQPRGQKPVQASSPKPAPQPDSQRQIPAAITSPAAIASPAAVTAPAAVTPPAAVASPDSFSIRAVAPANAPSIDFQTIAMAYGEYTKKSFEQTKAFVEKLAGVRSLDKAIEIQTEFAKQAYETFVHESQKIRELYSGLARQTVEGAVAKVIPAAR